MNSIKRIVDDLNLQEQALNVDEIDTIIASKYIELSDLATTPDVISYLDIMDLLSYFEDANFPFLKSYKERLERSQDVSEYNRIKKEIEKLKKEKYNYYITLQSDFRYQLSDRLGLYLPEIYVFQGNFDQNSNYKLGKHIISPNTVLTFDKPGIGEAIIYPAHECDAKRRLRHLYNKTSLSYLDQVVKTCDLGIEGKDFGKKVLVKTVHNNN